ncbi:MAG: endolytic transglycosylase MltG, partial [Oscillospiraceae bacterium]|nr:endolytic transglycosylase MltG [Oscillospiraceae bacterium]
DVVDIMFPEGATSLDIANKLQENGVCDADEFLAALNRRDYNYTFVENIPENELRFYDLEGYLFPNTHQFFVGESVDSVLNRFLKDFSSQITDEMRTRMNELNLTLDETLILASIIQKEASDPDEMKNISEVFHNRLRNSDTYPNLQSDPTIFYVERVIKQKIGMTNQPMYDAYNTYVCKGLPVAPICNPGIDAIEAALYPANHDVDYFYFVTDDEGKYYYAATLAEHNYNIAMADQVNARVEKEKEEAAKAEAAASSTAQ